MTLKISPAAEADLEEIADFIAADNPRRALSFIAELRHHCRKIETAPDSYPARPELAAGLRLCVHDKYLIFFQMLEKDITIIRILHGARDIERLFEA